MLLGLHTSLEGSLERPHTAEDFRSHLSHVASVALAGKRCF